MMDLSQDPEVTMELVAANFKADEGQSQNGFKPEERDSVGDSPLQTEGLRNGIANSDSDFLTQVRSFGGQSQSENRSMERDSIQAFPQQAKGSLNSIVSPDRDYLTKLPAELLIEILKYDATYIFYDDGFPCASALALALSCPIIYEALRTAFGPHRAAPAYRWFFDDGRLKLEGHLVVVEQWLGNAYRRFDHRRETFFLSREGYGEPGSQEERNFVFRLLMWNEICSQGDKCNNALRYTNYEGPISPDYPRGLPEYSGKLWWDATRTFVRGRDWAIIERAAAGARGGSYAKVLRLWAEATADEERELKQERNLQLTRETVKPTQSFS